jgi:hypothetical protein
MRTMIVIVPLELGQDGTQMSLTVDQQVIQAFAR